MPWTPSFTIAISIVLLHSEHSHLAQVLPYSTVTATRKAYKMAAAISDAKSGESGETLATKLAASFISEPEEASSSKPKVVVFMASRAVAKLTYSMH